MAQKLDAQGGTGGAAWDDGSDHDGVTKITVRQGGLGIQYVQFDYVKGGQPKQGALHGVHGSRGSLPKTVTINHPDEFMVSVEGWYDDSNVIQGIQFKTNKNDSEYFGYDFDPAGTKFTLGVQDKKIIGFHGSAGDHLNSIGAYFVPVATTTTKPSAPAKKLHAKGGDTGAEWDDAAHDNVTKVYVGQGQDGVAAVKFEYANGSQVVIGDERGQRTRLGFEDPFVLESDEYITIVEGTYDKIFGVDTIITMLKFTTNKNRTSDPYGLEGSTPFNFKKEGHKITGFHGRAGEYINAIGVYLAPVGTTPLTPAVPVKKLDAKGGETGAEWDDAAHDNVKKVYVGQGQDGIAAVKFEYTNGSQVVIGEERGKPTRLGYEDPFVLESDEYITIVEGTYDKIFGVDTVITMLKFKTNKDRTSIPYGLEGSTPFDHKDEGHKITGFHGRVNGDYISAIGVYVAPVGTIPLTPAKPAN